MQLTGGKAIIHITSPPGKMHACIRTIQILISSSLGREDERLLMMHDLAFANPQWSTLDDDLAFNYVVRRGYTDMKFIGIVKLSYNQYTDSLFELFEGKKERETRAIVRSIGKERVGILAMKKTTNPHFAVYGWDAKYTHRAMKLVRERLAWAESEVKRLRHRRSRYR